MLIASILLTAASCGKAGEPDGQTGEPIAAPTEAETEAVTEEPDDRFHLLTPENGSTVSTLTERMRDFYENRERYLADTNWRYRAKVGTLDITEPAPVVLTWEGGPGRLTVRDENGETVLSVVTESGCEFYNPLVGMTYSWSVGGSEAFRFTVDDTPPRWIFVEGTYNVRDMGGWKTRDGKTVKQGLLYRGCELEPFYTLTDRGIDTLINGIGIRTEIDLRAESLGNRKTSVLGDAVKYKLTPVDSYAGFINGSRVGCKLFFDLLADPETYPAYFHCMAGADRTGTAAVLLLALLNVEEESIYWEYELSTMSNLNLKSRNGEEFQALLELLRPYGADIYEQTANYLRSCGIKDETMDQIRSLFLTD